MGSTQQRLQVYTVPACVKCDVIKGWLKERAIEFEERTFDTDTQLEFIMKNIFGNPPILEIGEKIFPSEDLFPNEVFNEAKLMGVLNHTEA